MVQCLTPTLSRGNSDAQVFFNPGLPDKIIKAPGPQAGIKRYILSTGFARNNTAYSTSPPRYYVKQEEIQSSPTSRLLYHIFVKVKSYQPSKASARRTAAKIIKSRPDKAERLPVHWQQDLDNWLPLAVYILTFYIMGQPGHFPTQF